MIIQCKSCESKFRLDDSKVHSGGVKVRCTKCQNVFIVWPPEKGPVGLYKEEAPEKEGVAPDEGAGEGPDEGAGLSAEDTGAAGKEEEEEEEEAGQQSAPPLSFGDVDLSFIKKDAEGEPKDESGEAAETGDKSVEEERNEWKAALESELEEGPEETDKDELLKALNEALVRSDVGDEEAGEAVEAEGAEGAGGAGGAGAPVLDFTFDDKPSGKEEGISPEDIGIFDAPDKGAEGPAGEEGEGTMEEPGEEAGEEAGVGVGTEEAAEGEPYRAPVSEDEEAGVVLDISAESKEAAEDEADEEGPLLSPEGAQEPPRDFEEVLAGELSQEEGESESATGDEAGAGFEAGRPRHMGLGLVIVFLIIVAGGGVIYFSGIIDALTGSIISREAPSAKTVAIQNIDGYVAENRALGRVFVIEAKIRNIMSEPQEITGVRGVLYGSNGKKLAEKTVSPGRVLSNDDIRNLSEKDLIKSFKDASGGTLPPRGTVPIMVLFENIPKGTAEFGIEVLR
jgi:predicted Zn finger-like uncharacterized protein